MEVIGVQVEGGGYARAKVPTLADPVWRMFGDDKPVTYWRLVEGQEEDVRKVVQHCTHDAIQDLTREAMRTEDMALRKRYATGAMRLLQEIAGEVGDHSRTPAP